MNMTEILLRNTDSLQTKEWDHFLSPNKIDDAKDDDIWQYKLQLMIWMKMSFLSQEHCQLIKKYFLKCNYARQLCPL